MSSAADDPCARWAEGIDAAMVDELFTGNYPTTPTAQIWPECPLWCAATHDRDAFPDVDGTLARWHEAAVDGGGRWISITSTEQVDLFGHLTRTPPAVTLISEGVDFTPEQARTLAATIVAAAALAERLR